MIMYVQYSLVQQRDYTLIKVTSQKVTLQKYSSFLQKSMNNSIIQQEFKFAIK